LYTKNIDIQYTLLSNIFVISLIHVYNSSINVVDYFILVLQLRLFNGGYNHN